MLKAYKVEHAPSDPEWHEQAIVYHETAEAARELGRHHLSSGPSYAETEATRVPEHDARASQQSEPGVEEDASYLRDSGWRLEGEHACSCCGLAAMGMDEHAVCRTSGMCRECGCEEGTVDGDPECTHEDGFSCGG